MSYLAETYALAVGVKLSKPEIQESFFPLPTDPSKAILLHAFAGAVNNNQAVFPAKIYDYFNEVVFLLKPVLEPLGYTFYQIGGPGEPPLLGVKYLCGRTTENQCAYLLNRCALLIGNDSMWVHVRGSFEKPLVAIYGPTDVKNHGPYWRNSDKSVLIESHRFGRKPSYSSQESPKTINLIKPEDIAKGALKALDISDTINHETLWIGPNYNQAVFELIPNCVMAPNINANVIIRMDYHFNEEFLFKNLQLRKCVIFTSKEIDIQKLAQLKQSVISVNVEISPAISQAWIKQLKRLGVPTNFFCFEKDQSKITEMRLELFEACFFDLVALPTKTNFEEEAKVYLNKPLDPNINFGIVKFRTNKYLLSDGKLFLSKAHWLAGKSVESLENNSDSIIDSEDFWRDQAHYYFYI